MMQDDHILGASSIKKKERLIQRSKDYCIILYISDTAWLLQTCSFIVLLQIIRLSPICIHLLHGLKL